MKELRLFFPAKEISRERKRVGKKTHIKNIGKRKKKTHMRKIEKTFLCNFSLEGRKKETLNFKTSILKNIKNINKK